MTLTLIGAKSIISKKSGTEKPWLILHVGYQDNSYDAGIAVDTMVVDPQLCRGELIEGCHVVIDRSPDGKRILAVTFTA